MSTPAPTSTIAPTDTLVPTTAVTPASTAIPEPATAPNPTESSVGWAGRYIAAPGYSDVNLRAEPSAQARILDTMPYGMEVKARDATVPGGDGQPWREVIYDGQTGYALDSLLSADQPAATPTARPSPTETPTSAVAQAQPTEHPSSQSEGADSGAYQFTGNIYVIDSSIRQRMRYTWRPGCPVPLEDLRLLSVTYWGFDNAPHQGELVVNKDQAYNVLTVMKKLFEARFPIERMELVDDFGGSDERSMEANNTSAFNCRAVTGTTDQWSEHSYGIAVDINPRINPYVAADGTVLPYNGTQYADRSQDVPGMIHPNDVVVQAFASVGWKWGGYWSGPTDYQHFSSTGR